MKGKAAPFSRSYYIRRTRFASVIALTAALVIVGSNAANAAQPVEPASDAPIVALVRDSAGNLIPVDDVLDPRLGLNESRSTDPGQVHPQLINFTDWVNCFSLNQSENVFRLYTFYNNGSAQDVRLKCGVQNTNGSGWGYKHIRAGKEGSWQDKLNIAKEKGWVPESQNVEGWDDLMNIGAGTAITYWNYVSPIKANNTKCTVSNLTFARVGSNGSWQVVYNFNVVAVFAINSDRLITAYPTGSNVC